MREHIMRNDILPVDRQIGLFTRDRRHHVRTRIRPLLDLIRRNSHFVILQHRYYLSAPAYQGSDIVGMLTLLRSQQAIAPKADLVLLLDVPVAVALRRLRERQQRVGSFDNKAMLDAARTRYLALSKEGSEPIEVVNGVGSIRRVHERVWNILEPRLALRQ